MKVRMDGNLEVINVEIRKAARRLYRLDERPAHYQLPCDRWWKKGQKPVRDMRSKVYRAEGVLQPWKEPLQDLYEAAKFCRSVMETAWFQRRWPDFYLLEVRGLTRAQRVIAYASPRGYALMDKERVTCGRVTFSENGLSNWTALHEMAHAVTPRMHRHDRRWARAYVDLVGFKLGAEAGRVLKDSFKEVGLLTNPVRQAQVPQSTIARL